jgi:outer membrane receptor protein involved in Fe transport
MWYQGNPGMLDYTGTLSSAFVQDAWRPTRNLTLKIGVRYDTVSYKNDVDTTIADMNKLQPRLGFAWDVNGDAKTTVTGSWGRFMHPNDLVLPQWATVHSLPTDEFVSCRYFGLTAAQCQAAAASNGTQWSAGPNTWGPAGWYLYNVFGSQPSQVVHGLKPTYADEWNIGFEREIANRTSLGLTYIRKETKDIFEDTCDGNVPTPTAGGDCSYYIMSNIPGLRRDYEGVVLNLESRATDWFHLLANYTWSKSQGNVEGDLNEGTDYDIYPYLWQNRYGYLSDDRRHRVKVSGYFLLPDQFTVGFTGFWSAAFAYDLLTNNADPDYQSLAYGDVYLAPRGSFRANSNYQFDMQISKGFKLSGVNLQLIASIINLFNSQRPIGVCEYKLGCQSGTASYVWGQPDAWQTPRQYEAGFRIEF